MTTITKKGWTWIFIIIVIIIIAIVLFAYRDKLFKKSDSVVECDLDRVGYDKNGVYDILCECNPNKKGYNNSGQRNINCGPVTSGGGGGSSTGGSYCANPATLNKTKLLKRSTVPSPENCALQKSLGIKQDGYFGPITEAELYRKIGTKETTLSSYEACVLEGICYTG